MVLLMNLWKTMKKIMTNKEYKRQWYLKNKERVLKKRKKNYKKNKKEILEKQKIFYRKNKTKYIQTNKKWAKNNPDKIKTIAKKCENKRRNLQPWIFHWYKLRSRCNNPNNTGYKNYGGRGIKAYITKEEIKKLWFEYCAWRLKKPTIDRIDNNGNYTYKNCQFIENIDNVKKQDRKEN